MNKKPGIPTLGLVMYKSATVGERNRAMHIPAGMWEESFQVTMTPERFEALRAMALMIIAEGE